MTQPSLNIEIRSSAKNDKRENNSFCRDILEGLGSSPKFLQAKYFYDAKGDSLFQQIMACDEYYPFGCELEIFRDRPEEIADIILGQGTPFDLIELGAGDCAKSIYLLRHLDECNADFTYMPIDISNNIIEYLSARLPLAVPGLMIHGLNGDYFDMLEKVSSLSDRRKVVLFLGSNLGNMTPDEAEAFCWELNSYLAPGDMVLIGLDLKKNPATILAAYNDKQGITRAFNLNLLHRINTELGANFDVSNFEHYPMYDPATGSCKSYLVSTADQVVTIRTKDRNKTIRFRKDEEIFMEVSQKYTAEQISGLALKSGFEPVKMLFDQKKWFVDAIWRVI